MGLIAFGSDEWGDNSPREEPSWHGCKPDARLDAYQEALQRKLGEDHVFWVRRRTMILEAFEEADLLELELELERDRERLLPDFED